MNTITLTAIRPRGPENIWYINGDSLADIPFARLLNPGIPYKIVSALVYATHHGRDGVVAREVEFQLKPEVSEWHSAILFHKELHKFDRIRIGWIDYDPSQLPRLAKAQWDTLPEQRKQLPQYELSQAHWNRFLKGAVIPSPFHSDSLNWQICLYHPTTWQKACNLANQIDTLQEELEELLYDTV